MQFRGPINLKKYIFFPSLELLTGGFPGCPVEKDAADEKSTTPFATSHLNLVPPGAASPFMYL